MGATRARGAVYDHVALFWAKVKKTDGCWEWAKPTVRGYGYQTINNRPRQVHRLSWEMHYGAIPEGSLVCHHCDNRRCVRPDHLFLGSQADNAHDRDRKGRHVALHGSANGFARTTEADVLLMREAYAGGEFQTHIAKRFGVHNTTVNLIVNRKTWRHV